MKFVNQPESLLKDDPNSQESNEKDSMCQQLKCHIQQPGE